VVVHPDIGILFGAVVHLNIVVGDHYLLLHAGGGGKDADGTLHQFLVDQHVGVAAPLGAPFFLGEATAVVVLKLGL
jgi:hypothetical protein